MKIYKVYTADGTLDATGSADELSQKYFMSPEVIRHAACYGRKLLKKYSIVCAGTGMTPKKREKCETIAKLHNQGLNAIQISMRMGISESTVRKYLKEMREEGKL